ncbi:MAG: AAA family ATPase [Acidobacteria bacterium]|nr:AAA family ATPase [Acidobacteriota bacterium]
MTSSSKDNQIRIRLDDPSLVLLIGPAGAGKSTFAARHFRETEIISSDRFRALICDDEADQSVSKQAFRLLHMLTRMRLKQRKMTVIDATNLLPNSRLPFLRIARAFELPVVAIVFDVSLETCLANNRRRNHRSVDEGAVRQHVVVMERIMEKLEGEGYAAIHRLDEMTLDLVVIERSGIGLSD